MPWSTNIDPDHPIIKTIFWGILTPTELSDAFHETLSLVYQHDRTRILADCIGLSGGHSVIDLYYLADAFASKDMDRSLKEAVLLPSAPASAEKVEFWENTCYNRGLKVRMFNDHESAMDWLLA